MRQRAQRRNDLSRGAGTPNATPDDVEAHLVAIAECGGVRPAGRKLGIPETTLRQIADKHEERLAQIRADLRARRHERTAATLSALAEDIDAARVTLRGIVDSGGTEARDKSQATQALVKMASELDSQDRLDRGEPTAIDESRGKASDADVADLAGKLLNDPQLRAFMDTERAKKKTGTAGR